MRKNGRGERIAKGAFKEKLCEALDITPDTFFSASSVIVRDGRSVEIENGGRIISYTPDEIEVSLKKGRLKICGKRLSCVSFCKGAVRIDGRICSIHFGEDE